MSRGLSPERSGATAPRQRRILRRYLAVLTATALATVALPVAVASAAPTAGAALAAGSTVLPGAFTYKITVTNNRTGVLGTGGETINFVDILLPSTIGIKTAGTAPAPSGWTSRTTNLSGLQTYTFRGGSIAPGSALTFEFPASVAAPTADREGNFEVAVSSDDGATTSGATGALKTTIRTLEVLEGSLGATSPTGVTDQSGTAGQLIDYTARVKNHARGSQTVTHALSSNGSETITQAPAQALAAGAVGTFVSKVTLGGSADRNATFTSAASATGSNALSQSRAFEVQAPAAIAVAASSFEPKFSTGTTSEVFSLTATKTNKPALTLTSGSLTLPVGVTAGLRGLPMTAPLGASTVLSFGPAQLKAADGKYSVDYALAGVDDNGFQYTADRLKGTLANVLTIDSLKPIIRDLTVSLPLDADGRTQTAASNDGDVIRVDGKIEDASGISNCTAALQYVRLNPDGQGADIPVPATATSNGTGGCTFTGQVTTKKSPATFAADATEFVAEAGAKDPTGNTGDGASKATLVDLIAPVFDFAETRGTNAKADRITVGFTDAGLVFGACSRTQWKIDNELLVKEVQYSNGQPCVPGQAGPDNERVLLLIEPRDQDLQTNVTFTPGTRPAADPATDRAGQDALLATVKTAIGVAPAAPVLVKATRTNLETGKRETATLDEGSFFTNRTGNDLQVEFTGGRANYFVQVFDKDGNPVGAVQDGSAGVVTVPIGTTDGTYVRSIALINAAGKISDKTGMSIVLDRIAPKLGEVTKAGTNSVTVKFTEKLAGGSNFAEDWFVFENNPGQDPADPDDDRAYYQVSSVSGSGDSRTVSTNRALANIGPVGADYVKRSPSGIRYVDRAGNGLANTI
jgi:hypothetical protein